MQSSTTRARTRRAIALLAAGLVVGTMSAQSVATARTAVGGHHLRPSVPERPVKELLGPPRAALQGLSAPVAEGLPVTAPRGIRTRIDGLTLADQRTAAAGNSGTTEPPDQALCVGNGYVLEGVNDVFAIYSTTGAKLTGTQSYDPFWNDGTPEIIRHPDGTSTFGPLVTDPKCYYDPMLKRFFMTMLELGVDPTTGDFTGASSVNIAVSRSSRPTTTASGWHLYALNVRNDGTEGTSSHPGCPCFGDQPLIGADRHGFYVTTNELPIFQAGFNGAQLYAMDKRALANGQLKVQRLEAVDRQLAEGVAYSVQPATSPSASEWSSRANGTEYFMSALDYAHGYDNRIAVWAMTNTQSLTTPRPAVHVSARVIGSEVYGVPPPAVQKDGPTPLGTVLGEDENRIESNDDRMNQVVYADARLWSAVDTGVRSSVSSPPDAGIAYFVVSPRSTSAAGVPPSIDHQGYVNVAGNHLVFPSIGATSDGDAVMVFTLTGREYHPSAAQVHLAGSGALSSAVEMVKPGVMPADGFSGYAAFGGAGVERWGDYSAAVADGRGHVWTAVEYIPGTFGFPVFRANWGTYLSSVSP